MLETVTLTIEQPIYDVTLTVVEDVVNVNIIETSGDGGGAISVIDGFNSNSTIAAGSANNDRLLNNAIASLQVDNHTHSNKSIIDKFGENEQGKPTFNGVEVDTTIAQRDVYSGLDSTDNTISLAANQGKILKDAQDQIIARLEEIPISFADLENGVLDISKDFQPYNDYSGEEITNLNFSSEKKIGSEGFVRIKGGSIALDALPDVSVFPAGATLTSDVNQWNQIDYQYLSDNHIRIVLFILDSNFKPITQ